MSGLVKHKLVILIRYKEKLTLVLKTVFKKKQTSFTTTLLI